jgi:hypothetical protein
MDAANPKAIEWETLVGRYQQVDEMKDPTQHWKLMDRIFQLT